jgi:hypothetical protein
VSNAAGYGEYYEWPHQTFEDVPWGSTFHQWIERVAARGLMNGYECIDQHPLEPCVQPASRPYFRANNLATRGRPPSQ